MSEIMKWESRMSVYKITGGLSSEEKINVCMNVEINELRAAIAAQEAEISKLHEKLASLETSVPPVPEFSYVGSVQHLCELNDEWASKLPIGTKLYTMQPASEPPMTDQLTILRAALAALESNTPHMHTDGTWYDSCNNSQVNASIFSLRTLIESMEEQEAANG